VETGGVGGNKGALNSSKVVARKNEVGKGDKIIGGWKSGLQQKVQAWEGGKGGLETQIGIRKSIAGKSNILLVTVGGEKTWIWKGGKDGIVQ